MNDTEEVYLWGTRIGIIHQEVTKPYASFEYDTDFLNSGIEVSPLRMPLAKNIYEFPALTGFATPESAEWVPWNMYRQVRTLRISMRTSMYRRWLSSHPMYWQTERGFH